MTSFAGTMETSPNQAMAFRDPRRAAALRDRLESLCGEIDRDVAIMHVCGSHEQSIARFGLRSLLPEHLDVIMGPGCPVCVTDMPEVDEAVLLAERGVVIASFGDMLRVPGSIRSLAEAKAAGGDVRVIYSPWEVVEIAKRMPERDVVFFATGFETTAVATAAILKHNPPENLSVLSAHKYIPPVMEIVAEMPQTRVEGFLAAGHAAIVTGTRIFESFVERHRTPVVVGGFEPLDILAALARLLELIRDGKAAVDNAYPRCCTPEGNLNAQYMLWDVFEAEGGIWRGIAHVPNGNLRLRPEYAAHDARKRFELDLSSFWDSAAPGLTQSCICGNIMSGIASPHDCPLFGRECTPASPVGACMVSSEGTCKIWHQYGGHIAAKSA